MHAIEDWLLVKALKDSMAFTAELQIVGHKLRYINCRCEDSFHTYSHSCTLVPYSVIFSTQADA